LPEGLRIRALAIGTDGVTIEVATEGSAPCPVCGRPSSGIHRYCDHTLADLPWAGRAVKLRVRVRHIYCRNPSCSRKNFSERLAGTAGVYARCTIDRQTGKLLGIACEIGGETGSRQARDSGMPVSGDRLLGLLRGAPLPEGGIPPR
jgi:transposase